MKKLITICLLLATAFTVKAQESKPTKEQTIQFIQKTVNSAGNQSAFKISDNTVSWKDVSPKIGWNTISEITNVRFDKILKVYQWSLSSGENSNVSVEFSVNTIKYHTTGTIYDEVQDFKEDNGNSFQIIIPTDKLESIIKAFNRLKEITMEENKDPFEK